MTYEHKQRKQSVYYLEQINVPKNVGYVWQLSGSAGKPDSDLLLLKVHVSDYMARSAIQRKLIELTITLRTQTR